MIDIQKLTVEIKTALDQVSNTTQFEELRIKYLGRQGLINSLFSQLKDVPAAERKDFGVQLNQLKKNTEKLFESKNNLKTTSKKEKRKDDKQIHALKKHGHLHPLTQTERQLNHLFQKLGFSIYQGPEIETDEFCFQRLNVPSDHPARDMQDSIYILEPSTLLRTQTSAIEARLLSEQKPPFRVAFPGVVYRNEKVNRSNHFIFHQYQAVVVGKNISMKDLIGTMDLMFKTLYGPEVVVGYRCKYYPEVEPGVGPDMLCFQCQGKGCQMCKRAGWIEMGGSGMIHPKVLKAAGIDPKIWSGFAFGMGLDRWTMAQKHIKDIRTLQGGNLAYKPYQK